MAINPVIRVLNNPELGDTIDISQLPSLLANPFLLLAIQNAANAVGDTYQSFIDKLTASLQSCTDTCGNCYDTVVGTVADNYNTAENNFSEVIGNVYALLCAGAANTLSSATNGISQTVQIPSQAISNVPSGSFAIIFNCQPDKSQWNNPDIPYNIWFDPAFESYFVNNKGTVVKGSKLNTDNSYTFANGLTVPFTASGVTELKQLLAGGAFPIDPSYIDGAPIFATYQCGSLPIDASGNMETTAPVQAPVYAVPNPVSNPVSGSVVTTAPITSTSSGSIENVTNNTTNVTNNNGGVTACPQPIINVPAPIVNNIVNVAPCQPNITNIINSPVTTKGSGQSKFQCSDEWRIQLVLAGMDDNQLTAYQQLCDSGGFDNIGINPESESVDLEEVY